MAAPEDEIHRVSEFSVASETHRPAWKPAPALAVHVAGDEIAVVVRSQDGKDTRVELRSASTGARRGGFPVAHDVESMVVLPQPHGAPLLEARGVASVSRYALPRGEQRGATEECDEALYHGLLVDGRPHTVMHGFETGWRLASDAREVVGPLPKGAKGQRGYTPVRGSAWAATFPARGTELARIDARAGVAARATLTCAEMRDSAQRWVCTVDGVPDPEAGVTLVFGGGFYGNYAMWRVPDAGTGGGPVERAFYVQAAGTRDDAHNIVRVMPLLSPRYAVVLVSEGGRQWADRGPVERAELINLETGSITPLAPAVGCVVTGRGQFTIISTAGDATSYSVPNA